MSLMQWVEDGTSLESTAQQWTETNKDRVWQQCWGMQPSCVVTVSVQCQTHECSESWRSFWLSLKAGFATVLFTDERLAFSVRWGKIHTILCRILCTFLYASFSVIYIFWQTVNMNRAFLHKLNCEAPIWQSKTQHGSWGWWHVNYSLTLTCTSYPVWLASQHDTCCQPWSDKVGHWGTQSNREQKREEDEICQKQRHLKAKQC